MTRRHSPGASVGRALLLLFALILGLGVAFAFGLSWYWAPVIYLTGLVVAISA